MYDFIIDALKSRHNLDEGTLPDFLKNLQPFVKKLRTSYYSYPVLIDYSEENIQAAYLLAYFPHYTGLLPYILQKERQNISTYTYKEHELILFGGGPCPELIGYLIFLRNSATNIAVSNIDIAADTWLYSMNMNIHNIVPHYMTNNTIVNFQTRIEDITAIWNIEKSTLPTIAVFQNCLNESNITKHPIIIQNLIHLFTALPPESTIVIIDLANYSRVIDLIKGIEDELSKLDGYKLIRSIQELRINGKSPHSEPPSIIRNNLLTGEDCLMPRKNVSFTYSMIYKSQGLAT